MKKITLLLTLTTLGMGLLSSVAIAQTTTKNTTATETKSTTENQVPVTQTAQPTEVFNQTNSNPFNSTNEGSGSVLNLMNQLQMGGAKDMNQVSKEQNENINNQADKFRKLQLEKIKKMNSKNPKKSIPLPLGN
jgi:short subunit fatty acids transporter